MTAKKNSKFQFQEYTSVVYLKARTKSHDGKHLGNHSLLKKFRGTTNEF
jgi:hypothetical protein